jgi:hypothetical protein
LIAAYEFNTNLGYGPPPRSDAADGILMSKLQIGLLALAVIVVAAPVRAGEWPTHFACDYNQGHSWSYEGGKFKSAPPADLAFEISNIDLDKQSASLILGGQTSNTLKVVRALNANTFIEVANEGFLNLTTVYDRDAATGKYPAVHSRHFGLFGQPMFAQYEGNCTAKTDSK